MNRIPQIIIAGASGYIGKALIPQILQKFPNAEITALSRSEQRSDDPRINWKACDLFSPSSLEKALPVNADLAIYLVHSMGPTAQLDQGNFADYDLLLADNFARAMKKANISQMIYLGGLIPSATHLSLHLQSRLEVEEAFASHKLPTTVFRAGLILGEAGSSFQILLKLVKRLPVMICPQWTQTLTTPVDLDTVLKSIAAAALNHETIGHIYDLTGCEPLTYVQMMKETARKLGLKRSFITVPFFTPTLSRLWVRLITNTPKNLVYPLISSLEHPMVARKEHFFPNEHAKRTYFELLESVFLETRPGKPFLSFSAQGKTVRSVQRFILPPGKDAAWVKDQYLAWLPWALSPTIKVHVAKTGDHFSLRLFGVRVLDLKLNVSRSSPDLQWLDIVDGLLVSGEKRGWFEFRIVLNQRFVLAAIHDYRPWLPWFFYKYSQARVHLLVMKAFARHLSLISTKKRMMITTSV